MRRSNLASLFCGVSLALLAGAGAASAAPSTSIEEVVVTARRTNENLQDTPVAVSVISQAVIDKQGVFAPHNLTSVVPGLVVATQKENRDQVIFSIRGQNWVPYTAFPAVITYFDEVMITQLTAGQFFDLQNVQVLRGPQGVLFGRVTDGGNVMVTPKHPSNQFDGNFEVKLGNYNLNNYSGAVNIPLVDDKLMIRAAFDMERRDGFTTNIYNGKKLDDVKSDAFRIGVTMRPVESFENYTSIAYQHTHNHGTGTELYLVNPAGVSNAAGKVIPLFPGAYGINSNGDVVPFQAGMTPLTTANYVANLQALAAQQNALGPRKVNQTADLYDRRHNFSAINQSTWDITKDLQLKNVVGYVREIEYEASNYMGANGGAVLTCHEACGPYLSGLGAFQGPFLANEQLSEEIRLAGKSFDQKLTWSIGGYTDYQHPAKPLQNETIQLGVLHGAGLILQTTRSYAGFGYAEYDASDFLPGLKINGGVRRTRDSFASATENLSSVLPAPLAEAALATRVGAALAHATVIATLPAGQCVTYSAGIFSAACQHTYGSFTATTWTGGASYKLPSGQMFYGKVSRGYRPGGVNAAAASGSAVTYEPEYDTSFEAGFKGDFDLAGMKFRTDVAVYHDNYQDIQKHVTATTPTGASVGTTINVARAVIQGVEIEGTIEPVPGLTASVNYAYTDAHFKGVSPYTVQGNAAPLRSPAGANADPCDATLPAVLGFCTANRLGYTPQNQLGVTVNYKLPLDESVGAVTVGGHFYHQSSMAMNETSALNPDAVEPAYSTLDLNATWADVMGKPVDISFFMTNVTNKLYQAGSDALSQTASLGLSARIWAPPRMWGVGLKYRFGASAPGS